MSSNETLAENDDASSGDVVSSDGAVLEWWIVVLIVLVFLLILLAIVILVWIICEWRKKSILGDGDEEDRRTRRKDSDAGRFPAESADHEDEDVGEQRLSQDMQQNEEQRRRETRSREREEKQDKDHVGEKVRDVEEEPAKESDGDDDDAVSRYNDDVGNDPGPPARQMTPNSWNRTARYLNRTLARPAPAAHNVPPGTKYKPGIKGS